MSYRRKLPLILFGDVEDIATDWNSSGTPVITGTQTDPLGGTDAFLIEDDDGAGEEYVYPDNVTLTPNVDGEAIVAVFLKAGTASETQLRLYDATATATRHAVDVTWSGGVPSLATSSGSGTLFAPVALGSSWYLVRFSATAIVSGNNHRLEISPAGDTASATGTVYVFIRSVVLFSDPLDTVNAWPEPRDGSEWVKSASGLEDAWIVGTDEMLSGDVRWIPTVDVATPYNQTGWDGRAEAAWANVGWRAMLTYGWQKSTFTFVPDQSDADAGLHTCYLVEPIERMEPGREQANMTRTFTIQLRDSDGKPFEGY